MLYLRTTINGQYRYIDLFEDETISMDYSYAEIQDITSKNSTFTKTFSIPGSKENNDIFQHYYDVNSSMTDYDIRNVFVAEFLEDGFEIIKGYIRLENVSIENKNVTYNVTFYSNVGLLTSNIGDKILRDIDFTELDHPYNLDTISRSLYDPDFSGGTQPYEDGRVTYMLAQYGYDYDVDNNIITGSTPIIDFRSGSVPGYFDNLGTPLRYYYLKPAVQMKWLYEKIFSEAGFTIKSDFFETSYFKRFYLPLTFNTDSLYLSQSVRPEFHFLQDERITNNFSSQTINWVELPSPPGTPTSMERVLQLPVIADNINAHVFSNYTFVVPQIGTYTFKLTIEAFNTETDIDPVLDFDAVVEVFFHQIEQGGPNGVTGNTLYSYTANIPVTQALIRTSTFQVALDPSYSYAVDVNVNGSPFPAQLTYAELKMLDGPRTIYGDVELGLELPDTEEKQIDFISTINRRFNLVVVPDVDDEDTFVIEPIIDYLNRGDIIDWSDRLDYNSNISISPTTGVINGTLWMNAQDDEDYGSIEWKKTTNIIYGTRFKQLQLDYKSQTTEFNGQVSHPVDDILQNVNAPNITIPIYYITKENNNDGEVVLYYNARKTKPRLAFRGLNLPANNVGIFTNPTGQTLNNSFYLENIQVDIFPLYNRFTTYPFGLSGFTHAANFNKNHRFNQQEYDFSCYEDLYDVYYNDYINDLTNSDNRVLIASFYIHADEIAALRGNERIFVAGNYYRINKINGYDLTKRGLTEVELIKITGDYEPHRVRYYKLQNCSNPTDFKYTNTDLNFTIWAYVGKKVKIGTTCYTIFDDTYSESKTYEKLTIPFQDNSYLPLFYENCSCTTPITGVTIYQDFDCVVPQPTPPTPTETPTQYYYYILEDCLGGRQILARSTTLYPLGQVVRTAGGGSTCYFVFDVVSTPNTNDIINTYGSCDLCAADVPTPTPTKTPTPTPTPSTTPCNCVEFEAQNETNRSRNLTYRDCYGNEVIIPIPPFDNYIDCGCSGSMFGGGLTITEGPSCVEPSQTPSNTPTKTPTMTPTPTQTSGLAASPTPTPTSSGAAPSPTPTKTPTPTASTIVYNYLGRTTPDAADGPTACSTYLTARGYVGLKPLASLTIGDYLYDTYPASPTDGNNLWVALKVGGSGPAYSFQVADDGEILDTYTC